MPSLRSHPILARLVADYGMLGVLLLLCAYYAWGTYKLQHPTGGHAARVLARQLRASVDGEANVVVAAMPHEEDREFAENLVAELDGTPLHVVGRVNGQPVAILRTFDEVIGSGKQIDLVAASHSARLPVESIKGRRPPLAEAQIVLAEDYHWPTFLALENLLTVANSVVVIALIAVGMTMVIITGGIDLSVGSLLALSSVLTAKWILACGGDGEAAAGAMLLCCLGAVGACAAVGAFSGLMVAAFRVPAFIATLAMMQIARGLALSITGAQSIPGLPQSFRWLGLGGVTLRLGNRFEAEIPHAVILLAIVYVLAQLVMARTRLGRHIYAVGGNRQAAQLSGIHVGRVLLAVYLICGAMAGLGGVIEASQLRAGNPKSGVMYELDVIAAVVVGGTSLAGGEGKVFGTLIGAFIIAVIKNGMNLTGVEPYTQRIVLGAVILAAVLVDMARRDGFRQSLRKAAGFLRRTGRILGIRRAVP